MWVLTEGWYEDMVIKGVTDNESLAEVWAESDKYRDADGPFNLGEINV
ncbi:hypothetical protein ACFTXM_09655 [Streptomyces sp. NPDC056930]